jgi:HTH-type transcriptional regulator/antitoxin HigA
MATKYQPQTVSHPGETLREKLDELQMTPKEFAVRCNKADTIISEVLNGKRSITSDMAIQFESVTKIPAGFWTKRQERYNEAKIRNERKVAIAIAVPWARQFPYSDMAKKGWVVATRKAEEKVVALYDFFGMSSHISWENYYLKGALPASFRISLAHAKVPHAISAWLRKGDIEAGKLNAPAYSKKAFKAALPDLKAVMAEQPADYREQAQKILLATGVKLVFIPCIAKAPVNGVARWIEKNTTPLIQISSRYKRNDNFWFSLFHEIGHILLHGKKEIFLENVEYDGADKVKEDEADAFAMDWLLTKAEQDQVVADLPLAEEQIIAFAQHFGTHPAMIIGRLRYLGHYHYSQGKDLIVKLDWGENAC